MILLFPQCGGLGNQKEKGICNIFTEFLLLFLYSATSLLTCAAGGLGFILQTVFGKNQRERDMYNMYAEDQVLLLYRYILYICPLDMSKYFWKLYLVERVVLVICHNSGRKNKPNPLQGKRKIT